MKRTIAAAAASLLAAGMALADGHMPGDPEAGEKAFRQCKTCHSIVDGDGTVLLKGGKTGPNLWGLPGRQAGTEEGFKRYKKSIVAAGEAGLMWNMEDFLAYAVDPQKFLRAYLDDKKARSGMTFKLKKEADAQNIWAYIVSVSPEPGS